MDMSFVLGSALGSIIVRVVAGHLFVCLTISCLVL